MPIMFDNVLGMHERALNIQSHRSEILGANLANSDTPGYKAMDIDFKTVLQSAADGFEANNTFRVTHINHMQPEGLIYGMDIQYRQPLQPSLDGNTVEPHVEMAEFTENSMRYLTSLRIINGRLNGLMSAYRGE